MPYRNPEDKRKHNNDYHKNHLTKIHVRFPKTIYDAVIRPAIERSGMSVVDYCRRAVRKKIERDGL